MSAYYTQTSSPLLGSDRFHHYVSSPASSYSVVSGNPSGPGSSLVRYAYPGSFVNGQSVVYRGSSDLYGARTYSGYSYGPTILNSSPYVSQYSSGQYVIPKPKGVEANVQVTKFNKWVEDYSLAIGKSPLVKLNRIVGDAGATVLAKVEGRNPAFSVKCRIGASMIWDAEEKGLLKPGMTVVEPTSGNTGIALAFVCAARGYKCILTIPESMSVERRKTMKAFGATLVLTEAAKGMKGAIAKAEEIAATDPAKYYVPQQFNNPANPLVHQLTTGPEIWDATNGDVDVLVSGVGTGGTITGISTFWKARKALYSVAVEPIHSPVLTQTREGKELKPGPHKIQGIGAGFVPKVLNLNIIDEIATVNQDDALATARRLASEEGILAGISCGAAVHVAIQLAKQERFKGKTIVVILPDAGERYFSSALFDTPEFKALETANASSGFL